jgi:hypothetical protein
METWTRRLGHGDLDMETWTWRLGLRDMDVDMDMDMRRLVLLLYTKKNGLNCYAQEPLCSIIEI